MHPFILRHGFCGSIWSCNDFSAICFEMSFCLHDKSPLSFRLLAKLAASFALSYSNNQAITWQPFIWYCIIIGKISQFMRPEQLTMLLYLFLTLKGSWPAAPTERSFLTTNPKDWHQSLWLIIHWTIRLTSEMPLLFCTDCIQMKGSQSSHAGWMNLV